ncbi:hypothetical protein DH2020_025009 [Rehmannia glutinosa]|uniref:Aminotransferase class I/classII large domain-containing protein n=1 Tax=Rehmannia glutinosa TaxID=99300 RepID=A0ABR0W4L2_REHGL
MGGSVKMVEETLKLAYGENSDLINDKRIAAVQALSGTGACRLFADFQKRFPLIRKYTFQFQPGPKTKGLDFASLMDDIKNAPNGSFFLLHACAHNPTGVDPTEEQWKEISYQMKVKGHFAFFDMAYQGFASGDPERDAKSIRIFLGGRSLDWMCPIICKEYGTLWPKNWLPQLNFDLLSSLDEMQISTEQKPILSPDVVCEDEKQAVAVKSQLQQLARPMYSNPPVHGALIVSTILGDPDLKNLWLKEVKGMADRIIGMRTTLRDNLEKLGSPLSWEHITKQIGMFCYSGMTPEQVDRLTNEFHIYMTLNGRISMAGVTTGNVGYLANAIHEVTKSA